jgi:transcriptional regulator with XRE-family HTH domain
MDTLGKRTVMLRKLLGMTQKEFAIAGDFSQSNLSLLENDGVIPNLAFLMAIHEHFPQINLHWWITGKGEIMFKKKDFKEEDLNSLSPALKNFLINLKESVENIKMTGKTIKSTKYLPDS